MATVEAPLSTQTEYAIKKDRLEIRERYRDAYSRMTERFILEADPSSGVATDSHTKELEDDFRRIDTRAKQAGIMGHTLRAIQFHVVTVDYPYVEE